MKDYSELKERLGKAFKYEQESLEYLFALFHAKERSYKKTENLDLLIDRLGYYITSYSSKAYVGNYLSDLDEVLKQTNLVEYYFEEEQSWGPSYWCGDATKEGVELYRKFKEAENEKN